MACDDNLSLCVIVSVVPSNHDEWKYTNCILLLLFMVLLDFWEVFEGIKDWEPMIWGAIDRYILRAHKCTPKSYP
jgi:hypothetical protein